MNKAKTTNEKMIFKKRLYKFSKACIMNEVEKKTSKRNKKTLDIITDW
ncbi:hypothetical protein BAMY6639_14355 [Bacillus amyloliquefaciens UMAF6639]|nr:hypothetical protein BAMY6639_14355 [Bacillus amyloliquefaciens UMAF6639]